MAMGPPLQVAASSWELPPLFISMSGDSISTSVDWLSTDIGLKSRVAVERVRGDLEWGKQVGTGGKQVCIVVAGEETLWESLSIYRCGY